MFDVRFFFIFKGRLMNLARASPGLLFCIIFVASCFTNKYVLSVLKFTYPTLFQGWQTCSGALLLWVTGKLGWVEMKGFHRSAAVWCLPGSVFYLGNIYSGSRALSILPIPFFFVLQNVSEVVFSFLVRVTQKERSSWIKTLSITLMLMSAITLVLQHPQISTLQINIEDIRTMKEHVWNYVFGPNGYKWAVIHFCCVGSYRVLQRRSTLLSDLDQQFINYLVSILLLAFAAYPTGDFFGASEFPFIGSYEFHSMCFASAILAFFLMLASVILKNRLSSWHCGLWVFLAKILASGLSILIFSIELRPLTLCCILTNHAGEVLSVYFDRVQEE